MFLNICMGNFNSSYYLLRPQKNIPDKLFYRHEMYNTGETFATDCSPVGYKYHLLDTKTGKQIDSESINDIKPFANNKEMNNFTAVLVNEISKSILVKKN